MSTKTAPERDRTGATEVAHGVHVQCQFDQPYVTALCGTQLPWDDEIDVGVEETCVVCTDLHVCPLCGTAVLP